MIRRVQLFEFCDQSWIPEPLRQVGMGFLATVTRYTKIYQPTAPLLCALLERATIKQIVVLGAGSGGGIVDLVPHLPVGTPVILTDIYPDRSFVSNNPCLRYYPEPVDALNVPKELRGLRVMYTTFHHFSPTSAQRILADAVASREPIAIFEATERSFKGLFVSLLVPILILLFVPFVRPFRWSGLFFTYVLPVIPLFGGWDGIVSTLRSYNAAEFAAMVSDFPDYAWEFRVLKGPRGENIPSMTGSPKSR